MSRYAHAVTELVKDFPVASLAKPINALSVNIVVLQNLTEPIGPNCVDWFCAVTTVPIH